MATTESKLGDFAEDLGKLLGTAEAKAKGWLAQRHQITKTLEGIRDTANGLFASASVSVVRASQHEESQLSAHDFPVAVTCHLPSGRRLVNG
jgi:hypothetical protein